MIFAKLEDIKDSIEMIVFPDILAKNPYAFQENNVVIVKAQLSFKDAEPKLLCEAIKEI